MKRKRTKEMHLEYSKLKRAFIKFEISRCSCGEIGSIMSEDRNGYVTDFCKGCFLEECKVMGIENPILLPLFPCRS